MSNNITRIPNPPPISSLLKVLTVAASNKPAAELTLPELKARILDREKKLAELEKYLPYADGPAYSQDLARIRELKLELAALNMRVGILTTAGITDATTSVPNTENKGEN